jgi:hypothetical protein
MPMTATRRIILQGLLASTSVTMLPSLGQGQSAASMVGKTMPQLITEIFLVDEDYGVAYGHNRVQAVVEFVNDLVGRYYYYEELPPKVVQSYYVDYYQHQVLNGDIHQFVWNSRWHPLIVESVSGGLQAMGAHDQAALFSKARNFVERDRNRLNAFLESDYASSPASKEYMEELSKIDGDFFKSFAAHPDGQEAGWSQIANANAAWISTWPEVRWVTPEQYRQELERLAAIVPDLAERKQRAEENRPWQQKRIDDVVARSGQELLMLTGIERTASAAGVSGELWHIVTNRGHHRVMFANGEALMLQSERDEIIARVPAPEAKP